MAFSGSGSNSPTPRGAARIMPDLSRKDSEQPIPVRASGRQLGGSGTGARCGDQVLLIQHLGLSVERAPGRRWGFPTELCFALRDAEVGRAPVKLPVSDNVHMLFSRLPRLEARVIPAHPERLVKPNADSDNPIRPLLRVLQS